MQRTETNSQTKSSKAGHLSSPIGISTSGWCLCSLWSIHHPCITHITHTYKVTYKDDFSYILFLYSHRFIPFLIDCIPRWVIIIISQILTQNHIFFSRPLENKAPWCFFSRRNVSRILLYIFWTGSSMSLWMDREEFEVLCKKLFLNIHIKIIVVWHRVMICPNSSY